MTSSSALRFASPLLALLTAAALLAAVAPSARAADIVKANVAGGLGNYLKDGAAWVGGVAPGSNDTAVFDSTFTQTAGIPTAARLAWLGLEVTTGSTAIALGGSNAANTPLGLGVGGIDMSIAARTLSIAGFEQNANHTWSVGAGSSLTVGSVDIDQNGYVVALTGAGNVNVGASFTVGDGSAFTGTFTPTAGTLTLSGATDATFAGIIAGSQPVAKTGAGIYTLTGANSLSGAVAVTAGTLQVGNGGTAGALGSGALQLDADATLAFNRSDAVSVGNGWAAIGSTGTRTLRNDGAGLLTITGADISSGAAANLSLAGSGNGVFEKTIASGGGAGLSIQKQGTGTWTLTSNSNGYTGTTTVSAGTLQVGNGGTTGTIGTGNIILEAGATLAFNRTTAISVGNAWNSFAAGGTRTLKNDGSGLVTIAGSGNNIGGSSTAGETFALGGSGNGLIDQSITAGGADLSIVKQGTGTWTLSSTDNNFTGTTSITSGTLEITGLIGSPAESSTGDYTQAITNDGELHINTTSAQTLSGVLSGSGLLRKSASGTLTLSGTNTFTGGTTLAAGTLALDSAGALGSSGTLTLSGGTLQFSASNTTDYSSRFSAAAGQAYNIDTNGQDVTLATALTSSGGSLTKTGNGTLTLTAANTYDGATTISAGTLSIGDGGTAGGISSSSAVSVAAGATLAINRSDAITISNTISGSGSLTKTGIGTLTLTSASNAWTGGTTIAAGVLQVGDGTSDGTIGSGTITITNGRLAFNRPNPYTVTETFASFAVGTNPGIENNGAGQLTINVGNFNFDGALDLAFGGTGDGVVNGPIAIGGAAASILKDGAGTWVFNDVDNGYTGSTTINAGTLEITGLLGKGTYAQAITNDATLHFNSTSAQTISGVISGSGLLQKSAANTLTLSATNTYTGDTTISAGTLTVSGLLGSGSYAGAIANDGTLSFTTNSNQTLSGALSGSGALAKSGSGVLTLSGANTSTGTTTITAGTLQITESSSIAAGDISLPNGTLEFTRSSATAISSGLAVSGTGTTPALLNNGTGLLTIQPGSSTNIGVDNGETFTVGGSGDILIEKSIASGAGASLLTKTGSGTVTLTSSANNWSGGTTIAAGVLQVGDGTSDGAIGTGTITITNGRLAFNRPNAYTAAESIATFQGSTTPGIENNGAGLLTINAGNLSFAVDGIPLALGGTGDGLMDGPIAVGGSAASILKDGAGTWVFNDNNNGYTGSTTINAGTLEITGLLGKGTYAQPIANAATLHFNSTSNQTLSGVISGAGTLQKSNTGSLTLTAANTFTGTLLVDGGTLALGGSGSLAAATSVELNGGTLDLAGKTQTIASLSGTGGTLALGAGSLSIDTAATTSYAGAITGSVSLAKLGSGTLTLTGASPAYTGDVTVSGGTLVLDNDGALSTSVDLTVDSGATLTVNPGRTVRVSSFDLTSGVLAGTGVLEAATTTVDSATLNSPIVDAPGQSSNLVKTGSGTTTINAANTFTGTLDIQAGTVALGATGSFASASSLQLASGATLDLAGRSQAFAGVSGTGGTIALGSGALTVSGAGSFGGVISGTGSLTKDGTGDLVLTGANTFTGGTTVSAGRLSIDGSLASLAVTVSGGELGGSGSIAGSVSIGSGASFAPGNSIESISAGATTFDAGATFAYEVDSTNLGSLGTAADLLVVNGDLSIDNASVLTFADLNQTPQAFVEDTTVFAMINYTGTWNGGTFTYNSQALADGSRFMVGSQMWEIDYNATSGGLNYTGNYQPSSSFVTVTAVPEPSTYVMLAIAGGIGAIAARRRRLAK